MSKSIPSINERQQQILEYLAEYRYLTARDLWAVLEPYNRDPTAMTHKLSALCKADFIRRRELDLQMGGANPIVYSLLKAGALALNLKFGSQYYREPTADVVLFQQARLRLEWQLSSSGWDYIRPLTYGPANPKPKLTPQSRLLREALREPEIRRINASLEELKRGWRSSRWQTTDNEEPPVAPGTDPFEQVWDRNLAQSRQQEKARTEDHWRRYRIYEWLAQWGLLDPWDVPESTIAAMLRVTTGELTRNIPLQINDYVAYPRDKSVQPLLIILPHPDATRQFWLRVDAPRGGLPGRVNYYRPLVTMFRCIAVIDAGQKDEMARNELAAQLRQGRIRPLASTELTAYLREQGVSPAQQTVKPPPGAPEARA